MKIRISILALLLALFGGVARAQVGTQYSCNATNYPVAQVAVTGGCSYSASTATLNITAGTGTLTSISSALGITLTPDPITTTGTVGVNQAASLTWTGNEGFTPASGVAIASTGAAGSNGIVYSGTAPASSGGAGTSCGQSLLITGANGGATTGVGTTGGNGEGASITTGNGGSGAGGTSSSGGAGGSVGFVIGGGGAKQGIGTIGSSGSVYIQPRTAQQASAQIFQLKDFGGTTMFYIEPNGSWSASGLIDAGITLGNAVTLGNNINFNLGTNSSITGAAGTGGFNTGTMTGPVALPTGALSWAGAAGSTLALAADGNSSITNTTGTLGVDTATTLSLGATNATLIQISAAASRTKVSGGISYQTAAVNDANYTVDGASTVDRYVYETAMSAGRTITLPNASASNLGRTVTICNVSGSAQVITIGSNSINGAGTFGMNSAGYACTTLFSTGGLGKWIITANY